MLAVLTGWDPAGVGACKMPEPWDDARREAVSANRCSFLTRGAIPAERCADDHSRHGSHPVAKRQVSFAQFKGGRVNRGTELAGTTGPQLMATIRQQVAANRRAFAKPEVKAWCARRWRFLFLNEAVKDPVALDHATRRFWDRRSPRQRIAEYYLLGEAQAAWRDEQPEPTVARIEKTTFVACPGLLNGLLPVRDFHKQLPRIQQRFSMRVLRADAHPARGCEANVADLLRALNEGQGRDVHGDEIPPLSAVPPGDVFMLGYSKGAADLLTLLVKHPAIRSRVRCIFTWAGAIGGSEIADQTAGKFARSRLQQQALAIASDAKMFLPGALKLGKNAISRVHEFDTAAAVQDLTTKVRRAFLAEHAAALDALDLPMFYFSGATRLSEVPWSQRAGFRALSRIDQFNDMQVTRANASLPMPMATDLGALRGHHWDLAYPSFQKRRWLNNTYHPFPKEAALASIVILAAELGLID